jgi:hypothetical protein
MRLGLEAFRTMGGVALSSYFSGLLAEAYADAGMPEEGLKTLDLAEDHAEPWWRAELYRLRGEMLRRAEKGARATIKLKRKSIFTKQSISHAPRTPNLWSCVLQ